MSKERYNLVLIEPAGFKHTPVFADVARLLRASMGSLGHVCDIQTNRCRHDAINVLLGYQMLELTDELRRSPYIVYQLEQLTSWNDQIDEPAIKTLAAAQQVWDYSTRNIEVLAGRGIGNVKHLPLGYHPALERIAPAAQDIDVLHYGSMNPRRRSILDQLENNCRLVHLFGVYGAQRDDAIARSRIILNLHIDDEARFEQVRVSYLLNNSRFVISEPADDNPYHDMIITAPYEQIAQVCLDHLQDDAARRQATERAVRKFREMPMEEMLRGVLH